MARNEIVIDLTDSREFDVNITRSGNVFSVEIKTEHSKEEKILDEWQFDLLREAFNQQVPKKRQGAA